MCFLIQMLPLGCLYSDVIVVCDDATLRRPKIMRNLEFMSNQFLRLSMYQK